MKQGIRVNEQIRVPRIRLISAEGEQIGIVPLEEALSKAQESEMDLVEVAPDADPPVCKIVDYKKVIYKQKRKAREGRKKQRHVELKEVKMRPTIGVHDYEFKIRHIRQFVEQGHKAKVTVTFKGREVVHMDLGYKLLEKVVAELDSAVEVEAGPLRQGRSIALILAGKKEHDRTE